MLANAPMLHGTIGVMTEAGELLDCVKKHLYYGKPLDDTNAKEEIGDILWYLAQICNAKSWSMEEIMQANIDKLRARYPEKFTEDNAINRDLDAERQALEA